MEKIKEYLKMADMFELPINDDDRKAAVDLFSHMVTTPYSVDYTVTMSKYAAHAINSHDELVNQRNELLNALEAHEKFWVIREAELGELSPEARVVRDAGLIVISKTKGNVT